LQSGLGLVKESFGDDSSQLSGQLRSVMKDWQKGLESLNEKLKDSRKKNTPRQFLNQLFKKEEYQKQLGDLEHHMMTFGVLVAAMNQ
jgi:hypothetical protein